MRKLVTFQSLDVQQERTIARPAVFPVGVGDPSPVGRPTERSSKIVGYVSGNEFAFRPSQGRHNIDAIAVDGQAMKGNLSGVGRPRRADPIDEAGSMFRRDWLGPTKRQRISDLAVEKELSRN
jgi:hypothetical protein